MHAQKLVGIETRHFNEESKHLRNHYHLNFGIYTSLPTARGQLITLSVFNKKENEQHLLSVHQTHCRWTGLSYFRLTFIMWETRCLSSQCSFKWWNKKSTQAKKPVIGRGSIVRVSSTSLHQIRIWAELLVHSNFKGFHTIRNYLKLEY